MSNSELPKGYKLTEVGVIPGDWNVEHLENVTEQQRPISYGIVQTGPNITNGIPCLRVVDIHDGHINKTELIRTSQKISDGYKRTILKMGDLVIPLRGKVGDVGIIDSELEGANLTRGVAILAICLNFSNEFCRHFIAWSATRKRLEQAMNGSALQEIPIATLRTFKIALPSLPEQRSIATAISDMDELLGGLDRSIAKKRDLKQAAMQQLLTGKSRLPGFDREWKSFSLGELFEITAGRDLVKSGYSEVHSDTHPFPIYANSIFNVGLYGYSSFKEYESGCITVTARGTLGYACYRSVPFVAIGRLIVLSPKKEIDAFFLSEAINHRIEFASESTGVPQLTAPQIAKYELSIPVVKEQTAIASILSDMDTEIAAIEQRRNKTRDLKQAMMQELLTGRIRLKIKA